MVDAQTIDAGTLAPFVLAARVFLGLVFLLAATGKLQDRAAFAGIVSAYRLLPSALVVPAAWAIPAAEIAIGLALPSGLAPGLTALAAVAMLALFAGAMTVNLLRGRRDIDCGCFRGLPQKRLDWSGVRRTLALALAAAVTGLAVPVSLAASALGIAAGSVLCLLFLAASALPTHARRTPKISL